MLSKVDYTGKKCLTEQNVKDATISLARSIAFALIVECP